MTIFGGVALVAVLAASAPGGASSPPEPRLRLADRAPLTVHGSGFRRYESVTVTARTAVVQRLTVRAGAVGSFVAVFRRLRLDRCHGATVTAVGTTGNRAVLKLLPPPLCPPSLAPG